MYKTTSKKYLFSVVAGALSALMFATISMGGIAGVLGIYLSSTPIAAVGFILGLPMVAVAGLAGILLLTAIESSAAAFSFMVIDCIPVLLVVGLFLLGINKDKNDDAKSKAEFNYGFILASLSLLMALVMFVVARLVVAKMGTTLAENNLSVENISIRNILTVFLEKMIHETSPDLPIESEVFTKILVPFLPAIMVIMWFTHVLIGLALAIWGADKAKLAIRKQPEYKNMILPYWLVATVGLGILFGFVLEGDVGYLARNMGVVLFMPFVLLGFSVVHVFANKTKYPRTALFVFYSFFVVGSYWVVLAIGVLGIVENFIKLRHKTVAINLEE